MLVVLSNRLDHCHFEWSITNWFCFGQSNASRRPAGKPIQSALSHPPQGLQQVYYQWLGPPHLGGLPLGHQQLDFQGLCLPYLGWLHRGNQQGDYQGLGPPHLGGFPRGYQQLHYQWLGPPQLGGLGPLRHIYRPQQEQ